MRRLRLITPVLLILLAGCGSDSVGTSSATATGAGAPSGGGCTPAPAPAGGGGSAADSFSDSVCLVTTGDGLRYGDLVTGSGAVPQKGQTVTVQYTGWLTDGTVFDSSRKPGRTPFSFVIGTGQVIPGWDEGLITMHAGGKRRLVIPPSLAYGANPPGGLPANATLVFEVQMLSVGGTPPS